MSIDITWVAGVAAILGGIIGGGIGAWGTLRASRKQMDQTGRLTWASTIVGGLGVKDISEVIRRLRHEPDKLTRDNFVNTLWFESLTAPAPAEMREGIIRAVERKDWKKAEEGLILLLKGDWDWKY